MIVPRLLLTLALLAATTLGAGSASDKRWAGFYDHETLLYWQTQTPPGIEENFREVVWPALTPEEKRILGRVELNFPLEDASHPMNFYASSSGDRKVVSFPVSSLRFFGDVAIAYVWLKESGQSLEPVSEYLAMLKYQWPQDLAGYAYKPREALGVPANALANTRVADLFQKIYGSAIVFILGHELGHLYHGHRHDVPPEVSQRQEEEADQFGLEIMRRIGAAPVGVVPFFLTLAHLEPYKVDPNYVENLKAATHPLTSSRLRAVADALVGSATDFSRTGSSPATWPHIASDVRAIATTLDDAGAQDLLRNLGKAAKPGSLVARGVGGSTTHAHSPGDQAFSGAYKGKWRDAKGVDFDTIMNLTRDGNTVRGEYRFGEGQIKSTVTVQGSVDGNELSFNWKWGTQYFGKGVLKHNASSGKLTGTWGYTQAATGAGTWELDRAP